MSIHGYRTLSKDDIALINELKLKGEELAFLLAKVGDLLREQRLLSESDGQEAADLRIRLANAEPQRWLAMARTNLQQGIMFACRAVAQPTSF